MTYCGIEYSLKNRPALDGDFLPFAPWRQAYLAQAAHPIRIAIERQDGQTAVFDTRLRGGAYRQADLRFLERTVKLLLWSAFTAPADSGPSTWTSWRRCSSVPSVWKP